MREQTNSYLCAISRCGRGEYFWYINNNFPIPEPNFWSLTGFIRLYSELWNSENWSKQTIIKMNHQKSIKNNNRDTNTIKLKFTNRKYNKIAK